MEEVIRAALAQAAGGVAGREVAIELEYPDERYGDFTSNVAIKLAKELNRSPQELAQSLASEVAGSLEADIKEASIAGPGFINLRLSDSALKKEMEREPSKPLSGRSTVVEYSDPNPFKILHAGHLYTSIVGDAIANLLAQAGASVHRVNYGGDVGLHVGKSLYAILEHIGGEVNASKLAQIEPSSRSRWMSDCYVLGNKAYEENEAARQEIIKLNQRIYQIQASDDHASPLATIYWTTRAWSYEAFDRFYAQLNIHFDKFYPESEVAPIGLQTVQEQLAKGVFEMSDGAVVFKGEKYDLHTRVFINSHGIPTYEGKEIGLAMLKKRDFKMDRSIIITGSEQQQYMAVVIKAMSLFAPDLANQTTHLTHGMVRLSGGKKMSSRAGNILEADDVLSAASEAASKIADKQDFRVVLAAVKYSFLKQRLGGDIVYEPEESVSVLGNSGPYLQYAYARANSVLKKAGEFNESVGEKYEFTKDERGLALKLSRFSDTIESASRELSPHLLCTYLYDLAQEFNRFYEANRIIGDERQDLRLNLSKVYATRLRQGLELLGIDAPTRL